MKDSKSLPKTAFLRVPAIMLLAIIIIYKFIAVNYLDVSTINRANCGRLVMRKIIDGCMYRLKDTLNDREPYQLSKSDILNVPISRTPAISGDDRQAVEQYWEIAKPIWIIKDNNHFVMFMDDSSNGIGILSALSSSKPESAMNISFDPTNGLIWVNPLNVKTSGMIFEYRSL